MMFDCKNPDPSKTYLLSISGGKDSTAMWIYLKDVLKLPNIVCIFADTGWEHKDTYAYLDYLPPAMGQPIVTVKPDLDFVALAKKKKRFPSTKARFCTEYLKMIPARNWIRGEIAAGRLNADDLIQCSGVRHEESPARAKMDEFNETDDFYKLPQWRPIIAWTWQDVFAVHKQFGIRPNPLYEQGMGRVGCMPCIMANLPELGEIARRFPDVIDKVAEAEAEANVSRGDDTPSSFFAADTIPERFRSRTWTKKNVPVEVLNEVTGEMEPTGEVHDVVYRVATARDVFEYAKLEKPERLYGGKMTPLFTEPPNEDIGVCSSIYGLCE